ncbi:unnamed protein product [Pseudo-nitzschia multistriata]|uniref:Uncharacterized protein n=1 Tax=Pseudo-nitzschia multistriata TaxID=183589 RepID=A0A448ZE04_9STRA|nr:unnamed protein product [Pseudo-nitzschia multistriata]
MKFGIFGSKKKDGHEADPTAGVLSDPEEAESGVNMKWNDMYVEIDDDANETIANESYNSTTEKRCGGRTIPGSMSEPTMDGSRMNSAFVNKSFANNEEKQDDGPDSLEVPSNADSGTITNSTTEDCTINVDDLPDHLPQGVETNSKDFSITNNGKYLSNNYFANAQLMRWKHAAEEGPIFIQVLAALAAIGAMTTTIYPLVTFYTVWTAPLCICALHTTVLCSLIVTFEMRAWCVRNPMSLRARIRNLLVRYLNVLRFLWGRGLLYIFAGSMNITIYYKPYTSYSGFTLIALGILAIMVGGSSALNLEHLRLSLTDRSFLWSKFVEADSDSDNMINLTDFSNLIWSLGLELDDFYTYRAFSDVDKRSHSHITFDEFQYWWMASQDGDETVLTMAVSKISAFPSVAPSHYAVANSNYVPKHIKDHIPAHIKV